MKKLLRSQKGFTLVELIIVIVIIAVLIAALLPAVLGAIERANVAADQADARTIMTAASVWAQLQVPPQTYTGVGRPAAFNDVALGNQVPGFGAAQIGNILADGMAWRDGICVGLRYQDRSRNGVAVTTGAGSTDTGAWPTTGWTTPPGAVS